jgi:hypothetical protein
MVSNVWEYEDNCVPGTGGHENDDCPIRGDINLEMGNPAPCSYLTDPSPRYSDAGNDHYGFRCCWPQNPKP